jgi:hypothetical protein
MPTAVWTGTLSFGLVAVPVRLIPATEPKDVRSTSMTVRAGAFGTSGDGGSARGAGGTAVSCHNPERHRRTASTVK